jgi:hypothetical protein
MSTDAVDAVETPDPLAELVNAISDAVPLLWGYAERPDPGMRLGCMPVVRLIAALANKVIADDEAEHQALVKDILAGIFRPEPTP